jgi:hypothetical protein
MATDTMITPEDVIEALGKSSYYFEGSTDFDDHVPFIGHLIEIVGEDRLDELVGVANFCDISSKFTRWLATNKDFLAYGTFEGRRGSALAVDINALTADYVYRADRMQAVSENLEATLAEIEYTEEQIMGSSIIGLNDVAKELYGVGQLTFAKLLATSPESFLPVLGQYI